MQGKTATQSRNIGADGLAALGRILSGSQHMRASPPRPAYAGDAGRPVKQGNPVLSRSTLAAAAQAFHRGFQALAHTLQGLGQITDLIVVIGADRA